MTEEQAVMSAFMTDVRDDIKSIRTDIDSMNKLLIELGKLEVQHQATRESLQRAFASMEKLADKHDALDKRVQEIEKKMPGILETRGWIMMLVIGCAALVLVTLSTLVIRAPQYITVPAQTGK